MTPRRFDTLVLGAGAAGLFCAGRLAQAGQQVAVIDQARKPAEKVRISGGGRCNFTNRFSTHANFLSANPKFCISALKRFTPADFIALVEAAGIAYHEKSPALGSGDERALGQLFCDGSALEIIAMLLEPLRQAGSEIALSSPIEDVAALPEGGFAVTASGQVYQAARLVVATGGKSIPKMGASSIGYQIGAQFGHSLIEPRPGLVPFTLQGALLDDCKALAGVAVNVEAKVGKTRFEEGLLFTHRGVSGPVVLQLSSYWREGQAVSVNFLPGQPPVFEAWRALKHSQGKRRALDIVCETLPKALALWLLGEPLAAKNLADIPDKALGQLEERLQRFSLLPSGTEGYRTAEVTLGGLDTRQVSSQSFESLLHPGLYFIGEVLDVTGHLGGHNFQWAWASAAAAADAIAQQGPS